MRKTHLLMLGILLLVVAGAGVWWGASRAAQAREARVLRASGMLETTEVRLGSELGGRLATRPVREGERVGRGTLLAKFDTELLDHQIETSPDVATRLHLERQRERQTVRSPIDGWVLRTVFEPNEQVPPGAPVVVVGDLQQLTLKVFLPESQFGRVMLGQAAEISVDAYPGQIFVGEVTSIASEAEFAPRNVQTREDRVKMVYAVKLGVPNGDLRLKPGMFADAVFAVEPSAGVPH
jgi:multidrug efflux pump subunit AcrA (membrane-fusion protein)